MASNQIQQTGSFYLSGSFSASLGFDGTASYAKKATRVDNTITSGDGIESFAYNGGGAATVAVDTSSAHFNAPINAITGSVVKSGSISGTTLNLHLGDGTTLANVLASASYAITASHALNSANADTDIYDNIVVTVLNYGGQNKYTINGLEAPTLTLSRAGTYRFDLSDATNAGHPLAFRTIANASYTTGVTQVGTPGTAGAYTEIVVGFDTPVNLRYYCTVHGNIMGNLLNVTDMFTLSATGSLQGTLDGTATSASLATNNIVTASALINRITFEKGDGSTFDVFVAQSGSIATASFAESVEYDGILNKPTLVSGSSQISYTGITDIPYLVSESAQITLEDTTFTDGDAFSVLRTDGAGNVAFNFADRAYFNIRTTEVLIKGDPIYVSGYSIAQDRVIVGKADAADPAKMPVIGLAAEALGVNGNGQAITVGILDTTDTSTFTAGDELYVASGGGLTATAPTGGDEVQPVGIVIRSDAALGRINVAARMSSATAASATVDTGSLLTTASIAGVDITFTKGDASTFDITVDTGSSTADSASFSTRVTDLEDFSSSLDATYVTEAELVAATASLSSSLTTTDQTISSSVATLSGSASTSRDAIVASVSGAFASDSSSLAGRVTSLEDFSSSLDATYVTEAELVAATASLSASLTTTDQTISASVATLSGSASDSRNAIVANISGAFSIPDGTVSSSAQTISNLQGTDIISGSSQLPSGIVSSSAQTIANLPAGTVSGSAQVTGSTLITGSVKGNTLTFEKGDGSTFDLLVITSSGGGGSTDTGSLLTTASVSETTMSFTKGDASTFEVYITSSVSASFAETASLLLGSVESASFASTASFVTASNVHGPHGTSSVATASRAITSSKVDPISALSDLQHFVDDGAAGIGGIPKGGLYRNGNFVLIRIADIPFSQTHYLSSWGQNDYVDFGGRLTGFFEDNETWSYGWTEVASIPTGFTTYISYGTDDFAHGDIWTNATTRYVYNVHPTGNTTLQGHTTEPALSGFDSWLYTFDGTTRNGYLNGTLVFTSTVTTDMPSSGTGTGNITFGTDKVYTPNAPYAAGANSFYISDQVLGSSIGTTAFNNGGDITSDAEYSKVNSFVNVTSTGVIDITGNFTPTIQGTLTFTAVP